MPIAAEQFERDESPPCVQEAAAGGSCWQEAVAIGNGISAVASK